MGKYDIDDRAGPAAAVYRFLDHDEAKEVAWLWPGRIPLGCLSLLVGDPGVGKSLLTADIAARLSVPRRWPDKPAAEEVTRPAKLPPLEEATDEKSLGMALVRGYWGYGIMPTGTVFAAPEDRAALPGRLCAAGAESQCVSMLDGVRPGFSEESVLLPLRLPLHSVALAQAIRAHDRPRLVVLDPLHLLLDEGVHCSPDLQAVLLSRLAEIARETGVAILAVGHFGKAPARRALLRIRGSLSLVAAARSVLLVTADPQAGDRRIVTQVKNAYGPLARPLAFRIASSGGGAPHVSWEETAGDDWRLETGALDLSAEACSAVSEACEWLSDLLAGGSVSAREVLSAAHAAGVSRKTLFRAKRLLNVASVKEGRVWVWRAGARVPRVCC
jgi:hypothetical protein